MITSRRNRRIQEVRKLTKRAVRDRTGQFLVEGPISVLEGLSAGAKLGPAFVERPLRPRVSEVVEALKGKAEIVDVSGEVMESISGATTPPGVIAVARSVDLDVQTVLARRPVTSVLLADVRDPGNVGTILRSAWASGADAAFLSPSTADLYNPKVVRSAAGAVFSLPVVRDAVMPELLLQMQEQDVTVIACVPDGEVVYHKVDMTGPVALLFGN